MCDPVTAAIALGATATAGTIAQGVAANKQAAATRQALEVQSQKQAEEIQDQATQKGFDRTVEGLKERARARVAASQSGINLASRSFEALLQDSVATETRDKDRIKVNASNAQEARIARTQAGLNQNASQSGLMIGLNAAISGGQAAYTGYSAAGGFKKK